MLSTRLGRAINLALIPLLVDTAAILIIIALINTFLSVAFNRQGGILQVHIEPPLTSSGTITVAERLAWAVASLIPIWLVVSMLGALIIHSLTLLRGDRETPSG